MLPYPMVKRAGSPMAQASQGYLSYGFVGVLGNLACVSVAAIPVIVAVVLTNSDSSAIRMPVLVLSAAAYGTALAWIGVRIAARAAGQRLPELCQAAIRSKL
jgi:ABC-2 type transport system permease protein